MGRCKRTATIGTLFGGAPITNIRNVKSPHWRRWLGKGSRCIVPATSFCEYADTKPRKTPIWFALSEDRPLLAFAGLWTPWKGVRGPKNAAVEGDHELFGFLTTEANVVVAPVHAKAMPVILTTSDEVDRWLEADTVEALALQRPLADDALQVVALRLRLARTCGLLRVRLRRRLLAGRRFGRLFRAGASRLFGGGLGRRLGFGVLALGALGLVQRHRLLPVRVGPAFRASFLHPQMVRDFSNAFLAIRHRPSPYVGARCAAFRFRVAAAFFAASDRLAGGRAAAAAPPMRPPLCAAGWPVNFPRPEPPTFLPPPSSLLTVAQGNLRALMNMAGELLVCAAEREARQIDEKLFLETCAAPPAADAKAAAGRRR